MIFPVLTLYVVIRYRFWPFELSSRQIIVKKTLFTFRSSLNINHFFTCFIFYSFLFLISQNINLLFIYNIYLFLAIFNIYKFFFYKTRTIYTSHEYLLYEASSQTEHKNQPWSWANMKNISMYYGWVLFEKR